MNLVIQVKVSNKSGFCNLQKSPVKDSWTIASIIEYASSVIENYSRLYPEDVCFRYYIK